MKPLVLFIVVVMLLELAVAHGFVLPKRPIHDDWYNFGPEEEEDSAGKAQKKCIPNKFDCKFHTLANSKRIPFTTGKWLHDIDKNRMRIDLTTYKIGRKSECNNMDNEDLLEGEYLTDNECIKKKDQWNLFYLFDKSSLYVVKNNKKCTKHDLELNKIPKPCFNGVKKSDFRLGKGLQGHMWSAQSSKDKRVKLGVSLEHQTDYPLSVHVLFQDLLSHTHFFNFTEGSIDDKNFVPPAICKTRNWWWTFEEQDFEEIDELFYAAPWEVFN
eukprot:GEZU01024111.1.p1 GENE.GEZU01024111.1~~GEZU01024111.1.p1  ORF type:complete len:270 (-),score=128.00 GEZU01024111.1:78-887(-)